MVGQIRASGFGQVGLAITLVMSIRRNIDIRPIATVIKTLSLIAGLWLSVASAENARELSLLHALKAASSHERVIAALKNADAAEAEIQIADRAPPPIANASLSSIDLEHGIGAGSLSTQKSIDKGVGVDWTWERGGKRSLRIAVAKHHATALRAEYFDAIKNQQLSVIEQFYEALSAQERLAILSTLAQSADRMAILARARYALGDLSAQDLARLEIEAQRATAEFKQAQWLVDRAKKQLRLALGNRREGHSLEVPSNIVRTTEPSWSVQVEWPALRPMTDVDLNRLAFDWPAIQASLAHLQAARAQVDLVSAQDFSDPTYGIGLNHYPTTSKALLGLRASMPLYGKQYFAGDKQRASALLQATDHQHQDLMRRVNTEIYILYHQRNNAYHRLIQYEEEMLPKSLKVSLQAEQAFAQGGQTLTDLLEARRTYKSIQLEALQWRTDFAKAEQSLRLMLNELKP